MGLVFNCVLGDVALAAVVLFALLYAYVRRAHRYWLKRGVPYVRPTAFIGNLGGMLLQRESLGEYLRRVYEDHAGQPVVGIFAVHRPILVARDLDVVRRVFVKDAHVFLDRSFSPPEDAEPLLARSLFVLKGRKWRHMRIKLTPTFTSGKIKRMFYLIDKCGQELIPCIDHEIDKGGSVLVKDTVARYSTDVIASCAFGVNANALADPNCEFRVTMRKMFEPTGVQKFANLLSIFAPWLRKLTLLKSFDGSVNAFVRRTFWDVVEYRKKNGIDRKDFVDILMQIKNDGEVQTEDAKDLDEIKQDSKYMDMTHLQTEKKLDITLEDDDFVAQAFIFLVAGFETSSSVLSYTLLELALQPAIQEKLRKEILPILEKYNNEVTYDAITEMSYLEMVVAESMRKYPTVPVLERKCLSDYNIPGTDITIEKGRGVMIPVLGIHYDSHIYPEPHRFDPDRFSPENKKERSHFAHLPFGEGPRMCIGMRFGQVQVKTALVYILTTYQVRPCVDTPEMPLEMKAFSGILTPKKDIVLDFRKIKSTVT